MVSITGRVKDLIKSGGEWINPSEIEAIVGALPEVALAAVVGRADAKWDERPVLVIEPRKGVDISDAALLDALRGRRSDEHTSELQSLMRTSYAVFCLKKQQ